MSVAFNKIPPRQINTPWALGIIYVALMAAVFSAGDYVHRGIHGDFDQIAALEVAGARLRGEIAEAFGLDDQIQNYLTNDESSADLRRKRRDDVAATLNADITIIQNSFTAPGDEAAITALKDAVEIYRTASRDAEAASLAAGRTASSGLRAAFNAAAEDLENTFDQTADTRGFESAHFLTMRLAHERFFRGQHQESIANGEVARKHLLADIQAAAALSPQERTTLRNATDAYAAIFNKLATTLLKRTEARERLGRSFDATIPLVERVSAMVIERSDHLRSTALGTSQRISVVIASAGLLAAFLFLIIAVPSGRRLAAKETNLKEANVRLQDFAQASSDIFWEIDREGVVTRMEGPTGKYARIYGAHMVGRKFREFLNVYSAEFLEKVDLEALWRSGRAFKDLMFRGKLPSSGEAIWYSFSGIPIFTDDGQVEMYRCTARDATDSEKIRQESEMFRRQLEAVISHLPLAVYQYEQTDGTGRLTLATENVERVLGVSVKELNDHDNSAGYWFLHPDDRERFYNEIREGIQNYGVGVSRGRVVVKGETRWIQETARLRSGSVDSAADRPGMTYTIEGMWLDVTDDVRKTRRLSDFMSAIDSSTDLFMIADTETRRIEYCNAGYMRLLGLPENAPLPELYLGASGTPVGWELKAFLDKLIGDVKRDGRWVGEQDWRLLDGSIQTQFVRASQLPGNRLLITLTDITAERANTRELRNITTALAASSDGFLTAKMGHGPILYASPSVNRIVGAAEGESLVGKRLGSYITPLDADIQDLRDAAEQVVQSGERLIRRRSFRRRDGTILTLLNRASALDDDTLLIVMTDITEMARLERQVGDQRNELDRLIKNLPGVAYRLRFGGDGYVSDYASSRLAEISGYQEEELAEMTRTGVGLLLDPEDTQRRRRALDISRETGKPYEFTWGLRCKDGAIKWMFEKGNHFVQADGVITAQGYTADITDRVRYEHDLKRSREENLTIVRALNSAHEAIAMADTSGLITYANPAFEELLGIYCDEGVLADRVHEFALRQGDVWRELLIEVLATTRRDGHWTGEITIWTKKDEAKRVRVFATRGESDRIIFLASDVTEEADLREAQERQTNILAALSTDQSIAWTNLKAAAERIVAAAHRGLLSTHASLWMLEPDGQHLKCVFRIGENAQPDGDDTPFDIQEYAAYWDILNRERIVAIEDTLQPGIARLRPHVRFAGVQGAVLDVPVMRAGQTVGILNCRVVGTPRAWTMADKRFAVHLSDFASLAIETSERQVAMLQLRTANERLQAVVTALDSTQDRIAIEDSNGQLTYVNQPLAEAIAGGQQEKLIGHSFMATMESMLDKPAAVEDAVRTELARVGAWSGELTVRSPRGRRHLDVRVSRLSDGGVLYAATDKTEKHERDQEEAELKRQLADAQRMETIGRLAGGIAHDFNNIIGAARGFADLIADELPTGSTHQVYASRIVNTCQRASDLVREIMAFSRAAQGERVPVRVKDILSEGMSMMAEALSSGLQLTCINGVGSAAIEANPSQMIQVLTNLTLNSRDAIERPDGRISIRAERFRMESSQVDELEPGYHEIPMEAGKPLMRLIEGSLKLDHDYIRLSVEDNGSGMSKGTLQKIFEPFFTTKDRSRGTGLGVPTVASIVAAHRGAMRISTRPLHGTCFDIFIPVTYRDPEVMAEKREVAKVTGQERILIVDDEIDLADAMSLGLQRLGYEAVPLYSPREALQIFKEAPDAWDVVITDQVMPEMQGMRLIRKLKAVRPDIKIILYTGHSENATEAEVKKIGAEMFLYKPVTAEQLAGAVRSLFRT